MDGVILDLDPQSPIPLYLQIVEQVRRLLALGALKPGDRFLTVRQLGEGTELAWADQPGPYNIYRGSRRSGFPWTYNQSCMATNIPVSSEIEALSPFPGVVFFYVITRVDACGESVLGQSSDGLPEPNTHSCGSNGADEDGDGIIEALDNCPAISNANQLDTDADSIGDGCDNCPSKYNPTQQDIDRDGAGDACDPDIDGDAVLNGVDNCPYRANPGQLDTDGDLVGDACDNCPTISNRNQHDCNHNNIGDACDPRPCSARVHGLDR